MSAVSLNGFRCYVDSFNKSAGTDFNFKYQCSLPKIPKHLELNRVALINATIPRTWYLIQAGRNTFILSEPGSPNVTITIPAANYTRAAFSNTVTSLMTTNSPNKWIYSFIPSSTVTSGDTGKITWTVSGNNNIQPSLIFTDNEIVEQFGFDQSSTNVFSTNKLVSLYVNTFTPELTVYLHSNIVDEKDDILASIYDSGNTPQFGYMVYHSYDAKYGSRKFRGDDGGLFEFSIQSEKGVLLDTNGINMVFEIYIFRDNDMDYFDKQMEAWDKMTRSIMKIEQTLLEIKTISEHKPSDRITQPIDIRPSTSEPSQEEYMEVYGEQLPVHRVMVI